jgi:hypothetical protein
LLTSIFRVYFNYENGGSVFFRNVGKQPEDHTTQQTRKRESKLSRPWKFKILHQTKWRVVGEWREASACWEISFWLKASASWGKSFWLKASAIWGNYFGLKASMNTRRQAVPLFNFPWHLAYNYGKARKTSVRTAE